MIKPSSIAVFITAALMLTACDQTAQTPQTESTAVQIEGASTQIANPASEYCVSIGGELEIKSEPDGQVGICHLPSGENIEEWALYRKATKQDVTKAVDMVNPASAYCHSLQGKLELESGICTLPNDEAIDQWALYKRDHDKIQPQIGMANPAAVYCDSLKGKLDLASGICTLPNGEAIDQWALYKRDHKQQKPQIGIANPASVYCDSLQGKLELESGICTLPNGEAIEQWELYKRDHQPAT